MKKDNKLVKTTLFVLLITIVAIVLVSGTYAKYTSEGSGSSTATVAKWSIKVNGDELAVENPSVTFNLFETINDTGNTALETDVKSGLIAPGTSGSFDLKVKNESEVTAKYAISFEVSESDIPLEFSTDGGTTWEDSITAPAEKTLAVGAAEETLTVQWRWVYEVKDATDTNIVDANVDIADTALGIEAQTTPAEVTVTTTLTATQVD